MTEFERNALEELADNYKKLNAFQKFIFPANLGRALATGKATDEMLSLARASNPNRFQNFFIGALSQFFKLIANKTVEMTLIAGKPETTKPVIMVKEGSSTTRMLEQITPIQPLKDSTPPQTATHTDDIHPDDASTTVVIEPIRPSITEQANTAYQKKSGDEGDTRNAMLFMTRNGLLKTEDAQENLDDVLKAKRKLDMAQALYSGGFDKDEKMDLKANRRAIGASQNPADTSRALRSLGNTTILDKSNPQAEINRKAIAEHTNPVAIAEIFAYTPTLTDDVRAEILKQTNVENISWALSKMGEAGLLSEADGGKNFDTLIRLSEGMCDESVRWDRMDTSKLTATSWGKLVTEYEERQIPMSSPNQ